MYQFGSLDIFLSPRCGSVDLITHVMLLDPDIDQPLVFNDNQLGAFAYLSKSKIVYFMVNQR